MNKASEQLCNFFMSGNNQKYFSEILNRKIRDSEFYLKRLEYKG